MHTHTHGGRRRSPEIPWLLVVTVVGIIVVVIVAFFFLSGLVGSSAGTTSSGTATVKPTTSAAASFITSASTTSAIVIATTTPVTIPATGVYVKVDYIGGFSGTYTTNGETVKETDSGTRMYLVANATSTVTAVFQKSDNTATHPLTVSIYKNGSQVATNSTSAAYGKVTVTASV